MPPSLPSGKGAVDVSIVNTCSDEGESTAEYDKAGAVIRYDVVVSTSDAYRVSWYSGRYVNGDTGVGDVLADDASDVSGKCEY